MMEFIDFPIVQMNDLAYNPIPVNSAINTKGNYVKTILIIIVIGGIIYGTSRIFKKTAEKS